jgi:purine-binding chemotaxis protein CheW
MSHQYMAFSLGTQEYAVNILQVREIRVWDGATRLPNTPDYVKGVINLRGEIVPVMDLREKYSVGPPEYNSRTVVMILQTGDEKQARHVGVVVDTVSDVHQIPDEEIQPCPQIGAAVSAESIKGLATVEDRMLILLDVDQLLGLKALNQERRTEFS